MTVVTAPRKPGLAARRTGYVFALVINAAILYGANVWPGWDALDFLTADMSRVMPLVNASILVSLAANLVYLVRDPRWLKALGDVVTTSVGVAAMLRMWTVFPFDFGDTGIDWSAVVRVLLAVGIVGGSIGIIVAAVTFVRAVTTHR